MAWLSDWAKRLKIDINNTRFDTDLTNFPVMITLSSGSGLTVFNSTDVFNTLTPVTSGSLLFGEDFTASGTNWTHVAGTTVYTSGYMSQTGASTIDQTTNSFYFGDNFDVKVKFRVAQSTGPQDFARIAFNYDQATDTYPLMFELYTYTTAPNSYLRAYKKPAGSAIIIFTDNQYNYVSTQWVWVRAVRENAKLYVKIWIHPAAEPVNWTYEYDNVYDAYSYAFNTGKIRCWGGTTASRPAEYDDITVTSRTVNDPKNYAKRIAVTSGDGVTQLPVEIEHWNPDRKQAWLWTKVPTVASGSTTSLYLYYDNTKPENIQYVGYTNSAPAQSVWDTDYVFVHHCNAPPMLGVFYDSTYYNNDSTAYSVDSNNWTLAPAGLVYVLNQSEADRIEFGNQTSLQFTTTPFTVEALARTYDNAGTVPGRQAVGKGLAQPTLNRMSWYLEQTTANRWSFTVCPNGNEASRVLVTATNNMVANVWDYVVGKYIPSTSVTLWLNDVQANINTTTIPSSIYNSTDSLMIGAGYRTDNVNNHFNGEVTEVRVSKIIRSDAWLKATYYTLLDQVITIASMEAPPNFYYDGYVKEHGDPVARTVRLYLRSSGEFMSEDVSNGTTGYYYLTTSISGEHFIVAFDDDAGAYYNALVLDRIEPKGIVI